MKNIKVTTALIAIITSTVAQANVSTLETSRTELQNSILQPKKELSIPGDTFFEKTPENMNRSIFLEDECCFLGGSITEADLVYTPDSDEEREELQVQLSRQNSSDNLTQAANKFEKASSAWSMIVSSVSWVINKLIACFTR